MNALAQATPPASSLVAGSSFYAALRILPLAQRQAMYEVYAFCRAVDDIADDPGPRPERMAALARWRQDLDLLYSEGAVSELTRGLATPVNRFALRLEDFLAVISGMTMDVAEEVWAPDWELLGLDCDRCASAGGRPPVRIFAVS